MAPSLSGQNYTFDQCTRDFGEYYKDHTQDQLDSSMPWIGMYIAAASAACTIAMSADAVNGFRTKKLWFPCKYFSLNAFFLTVLAVSMKLPADLTGRMKGTNDKLAQVSSLILMLTAMANFMASLGSMGNNEIVLNLAALGILVITVAANASLHIFQIRHYHSAKLILGEKLGSIISMLLLLVILCSSAVTVPTAKRYIESQYKQTHKRISNEQEIFTTDGLRVAVRRYWMMAQSGAPQFVIARSVMCVTPGVMCLLMSLTLLEAHIRMPLQYINLSRTSSHYKWSTSWILFIQSIGVATGTIAPLLRWFNAARIKSTKIGDKSFRDELKVEAYWTQSLNQWRDSPLPIKIGHHKFRKFLHDAKRSLLSLCIGVQILNVRVSKLVLLISAFSVKGLMYCYSKEPDNSVEMDMDLSHYIVLLEGEAELPKRTLENIRNDVDNLIQIGKMKQPENLIKLLRKSVNFNGVREFDNSEILSLPCQGPPNCWSLPVVTLTCLAISLPNITDGKSEQLLSSVSQGLYFAKLVEKALDSNGELSSIRNAADVVWTGVELYRKWQDNDLKAAGLKGRTHMETIQTLSDIAEKMVKNFTSDTNNVLVQDPLSWPVKVIAANSMYRITQTLRLSHGCDHPQTDEEMFERLSIMISDILAACLTNLARVIILKCHVCPINEREENVRRAAILLGESDEVLETLETRERPTMHPENAARIEGWRAVMEQDNESPVASVPTMFRQTHRGHVTIEVES